ncbi:hypothetical protein LCGC14_0910850 [marine sediment metagenome]|uniref:Uncharacterized protein n=1 Tax=marine sediment metagenome TaxID=412755 RepID=A0A0F9NTS7_9ZZZZ
MENLKLVLESQKKEIDELKSALKHNNKIHIETRGRKRKYKDPLVCHMGFTCTTEQKKRMKEKLKDVNIDLSTFIRELIFGHE